MPNYLFSASTLAFAASASAFFHGVKPFHGKSDPQAPLAGEKEEEPPRFPACSSGASPVVSSRGFLRVFLLLSAILIAGWFLLLGVPFVYRLRLGFRFYLRLHRFALLRPLGLPLAGFLALLLPGIFPWLFHLPRGCSCFLLNARHSLVRSLLRLFLLGPGLPYFRLSFGLGLVLRFNLAVFGIRWLRFFAWRRLVLSGLRLLILNRRLVRFLLGLLQFPLAVRVLWFRLNLVLLYGGSLRLGRCLFIGEPTGWLAHDRRSLSLDFGRLEFLWLSCGCGVHDLKRPPLIAGFPDVLTTLFQHPTFLIGNFLESDRTVLSFCQLIQRGSHHQAMLLQFSSIPLEYSLGGPCLRGTRGLMITAILV